MKSSASPATRGILRALAPILLPFVLACLPAAAATITISPVPVGGKVTSSPGGLNCGSGGSTCTSTNIATGVGVTLTATPDAGYSFVEWSISGLGATSTNPLSFSMPPSAVTGAATFIGTAPAITSANGATFTAGQAGSFTVTATGTPAPTFSITAGTLPSGIAFSAGGTLSGTPAAGTGGAHALTLRAANGVPPAATQGFTLTVNEAIAFTSPNHATFTVLSAGTFAVTTSGYPPAYGYLLDWGTLPAGVTLAYNGTLSGTPASGTAGTYYIDIVADCGFSCSFAMQSFTLTVAKAPQSIAFANPGRKNTATAPFAVAPTATSGLAVAVASSTPAICTVSGLTVTLAGTAGTCTLTGTQAGNADYLAAVPVEVSFIVEPALYTSRLAGKVGPSPSPDGFPSRATSLQLPGGIAFDAAGNVFVSETSGHRIRRIDHATGIVTTVAGTGQRGFAGDGGPATHALFDEPLNLAVDAAGNLYVAEMANKRIRRIDAATGIITTVAGNGERACGASDVPATSQPLTPEVLLAVDASGVLHVSEYDCNRVRKLVGGAFVPVAGTGEAGYDGDGGAATLARLSEPFGIHISAAGALYIAQYGSCVVRKVSGGVITTVMGNGTCSDPVDGAAATATPMWRPHAVATDPDGNLYVGTWGALRLDALSGTVTRISGAGMNEPYVDGLAIQAYATDVYRIGWRANGRLAFANPWDDYIAEIGPAEPIAFTSPPGTVLPEQSPGRRLVSASGFPRPAFAVSAGTLPTGVTLSPEGVLSGTPAAGTRGTHVVTITAQNGVAAPVQQAFTLEIGAPVVIDTVAGNGAAGYTGDGVAATAAAVNGAKGVARDAAGNLYLADTGNHRIRRVDAATGLITTIAGTGAGGFGGDSGPATAAMLQSPTFLAFDPAGNLHVADTGNNRVRRIDKLLGTIATVAGNGTTTYGGEGVAATTSGLASPTGIVFDAGGALYVAESAGHRVRRVSGGLVTTFAGTGLADFFNDNGPATAAPLHSPGGLAFSPGGELLIADTGNHRVRRVSGSYISTLAGNGTASSTGDGGIAILATLDLPVAVATDAAGGTWVSTAGRVRFIERPMGVVTTWTGTGTAGFAGDGGAAALAAVQPWQLAVAPSGDLWVADSANHRVRRIGPPSTAIAIGGSLATTFVQGEPGTFTVTASGFPRASFAAVGALPAGVTLSAAGVLSGTPAETGVFAFTVIATNNVSAPDAKTFTLTVTPGSFVLTVSRAGNGVGTVTSTLPGIDCGATCAASFAHDSTVTLAAASAAGSLFAGWGGACAGTGACQVVMDQARSVSATFALEPSADSDGDGIPNGVEIAEGRNPLAKDNDIFSPGAGSARLFAMQMYRDFLNREGDPAGIQGWTDLITAGTYTRAQVIDAFLSSAEFGGFVAPVVRLYFATFLRVPDYDGLVFNAGLVRAGALTPVQLADFFANSPEFLATYGALTHTQFVTLLYNNVLGRAPDPDGLNGWVALLNGGMSRGQVLYGFAESPEYQAAMANEVFVTMMYAGMLRRTPEPTGFSGWVNFLDAGTYTREQVINGFFLSTEYYGRFLP